MKKKFYWLSGTVIGLLLLYLLNPVDYVWAPKCPFKLLTGLSCPGCGFQRAVHALLHGRCAEAMSYNYWFAYAVPYALMFPVDRFLLKGAWKERIRRVIEHRYVAGFYVFSFTVWFFIRNYYNI